jgi:hypothetical protein
VNGKADPNAMTGDDLLGFVNSKLFPYLKQFRGSAPDPETIDYKIGEIFTEIVNKVRSDYLQRTRTRGTSAQVYAMTDNQACQCRTKQRRSPNATLL